MEIPKIPIEYIGETKKGCGYTLSAPREWTQKEIEWVKTWHELGYTTQQIAESVGRTQTSVAIKIKRLSKSNKTYNINHLEDKTKTNMAFIEYLKPKSILDLYSGQNSIYCGVSNTITTNDINKDFKTDYNLPALKCCCELYLKDKKYDFVDLDPFGSAYECFDLAIKLATKGIAITFGELGHKRFKRLDFVRRYYGIEKFEDFTLDNLINEVIKIGRKNKKELIVIEKREWNNIGRVWFEIKPIKIIEQWGYL